MIDKAFLVSITIFMLSGTQNQIQEVGNSFLPSVLKFCLPYLLDEVSGTFINPISPLYTLEYRNMFRLWETINLEFFSCTC